ncbi:MAG TPA: GspE/PulE family protein [Candidatus Microsaccharimonas sp.]|nr:GspE/PulE family protein [Candidatus Microsaccharimonas sp.]
MTLTDDELAKVLEHLKYLPAPKLEAAKVDAKREQTSLYEALIQHDYLNEDEVGKVIAYHYQMPYVSLSKVNISEQVLKLIPEQVAAEYRTVPFEFTSGTLHIASNQPDAEDLFAMLAKKVGAAEYKVSFATEPGIAAALHLYKQDLQAVFDDLLAKSQNSNEPIAKLVDKLFEYAYDARASDLHIEPLREQTVVRFRIDGVLHDEVFFPKKIHDQIVTRLKVLARLRTDEHLSAQDGRLHVTINDEQLTVRVSIVPNVMGEKVVMRLLAKHSRQFSLTDLGMSQDDLQQVRDGFSRPFGMILSTGPTGSGKTTTMYAILKILNTRDRNIATIEDPVEYELDGINQIQANAKTNLTFSEGLRSLLRQDPDVLFVGEIRDEETADIAVNAAMTGHLVLSTMHTNDAVTTLPRLVDMRIEPFLAASTVNVIVAQRLVRQICSHCKASIELKRTTKGWAGNSEQTAVLNALDAKMVDKHFGKKAAVRVYHGTGCTACHDTGYQGRIGIFEVLEVTPKLAQLITARADSDTLMAQAVADGMNTMLDDGLDKVLNGETTLLEILRVTEV